MGFMSSLTGSNKMPAYLEQLNKDSAAYQQAQMKANKSNWSAAQAASQLGADSDIGYGTAAGNFLNANPYIDQMVNNTTRQIADNYNNSLIPQAMSNYAASGRYGGGLMQQNLANMQSQMNQDIGNAAGNMYYQNYNTERGYQEAAQNRLGQQYDALNRNSMYSNILNQGQTQTTPYMDSNSGLLGALGTISGMAGAGANVYSAVKS